MCWNPPFSLKAYKGIRNTRTDPLLRRVRQIVHAITPAVLVGLRKATPVAQPSLIPCDDGNGPLVGAILFILSE